MGWKFRWKNLIFVGLLIVVFIEILVVFPHQLEKKAKKSENPVETVIDGPVQKMGGVHLAESQKGNRDWELFAEKAQGGQGDTEWKLKKVKVQYYNNDAVDFVVTGEDGILESTKNMKISGRVVTKSSNGYIFKTELVRYDARERVITSPSQIHMTGPSDSEGLGFSLTGDRMTVHVEEGQMLIDGNVRARRSMKGNKILSISSEQASFSGKNNEAQFKGGVEIFDGSMKITGPEATFLYSPGSRSLKSIQVRGGAKVVGQDKVATSDLLNIDLQQNTFRFSGRPQVTQNEDELTGDEIIFLEGGKKVKVQKVRARMDNRP